MFNTSTLGIRPKHTRRKEFGLPNALRNPKPRSTRSIQFQHYYPYKIVPLEGVTEPKLQI